MKRFLTFLAAACMVALSSCQREPAPELQFSQALYTAYTGGGEVEVVLQISKSQDADLSIPAIFSGSAVKGTDYTVSAEAFSIRRGQTSGTITIKNISLTEEKQVSITFNAPAGCTAGVRNTAVVAPDDKEMLICSFTATQAVVLESYIATVDVTGATTGSDFKASERIELPLKVTGSGASEIAAGKIIIEAGQSKGRAEINLANKSFSGEAVAALSFESGGRVLPGDNDELLLLIRGLQTPDKLIGTWKFAEVYDLEELELWFMEMEDDPDELPTHNDGFVLTFAKEGSDVYVTPSGSGDFNKFFRKAKVSLATPVNLTSSGIKLGQYSTDEANMFVSEVAEKYQQNTYYELDKANLDFSADSETIGKAKIVFRITPDGDLAMEFRQYDNADCFGMMWWDDGSKFDPEMFGFASRFTRQKRMKLSKLIFPAVAASVAIAQITGLPSRNPVHHTVIQVSIDTLLDDTVALNKAVADTVKPVRDTVKTVSDDDFWDDDYDLFSDSKDTLPKITARDTMKVPDSLRTTDPFLYKWYVATRDSLIHRIVVDSLKEAGDSIDWIRIDSLYLDDSTRVAKEKFDAWYNSLDKKARKKYDFEQALPAKLHRMDSIQDVKDSLKRIRDSIRKSTPRILETPFIPDSMQYKRLISWKHDQYFNKVALENWDTTFNYHFRDYPYLRKDVGGAFLGVAGSAVETYDFFKRENETSISWYAPYDSWTYTPSTLPMFNTKTPYTELEYHGTLLSNDKKESDNIRIFTTQNIFPELNFTLEYKRYGGGGILEHESTANKTFVASVNRLGKKHLLHAGYIYNKIVRNENGGLVDNYWIRDTTVEAREIAVHLSNAANQYKKNTVFLDQTYRIPFNFLKNIGKRSRKADTAAVEVADSLSAESLAETEDFSDPEEEESDTVAVKIRESEDVTTAFIGHSSEYSVFTKIYTDQISSSDKSGSDFFGGRFYLNPRGSSDSLRVMKLDNKVFLRLQPWSENAIVSKVEAGIGDRLLSHYGFRDKGYIQKTSNDLWNSVYVYAGAEGRLKKYVLWNALGSYTFLGHEINDLNVKASATLNVYPFRRRPDSPMSLTAGFSTSLKEPDWFQQHMLSNHFRWENDFGKISDTRFTASFSIPEWHLYIDAGYSLLSGNIYYGPDGMPAQNTAPMSVLKGSITKNFTIGKILHLDNTVLAQLSSNQEVLPLPTIAARARWYIQFPIVSENVMRMQIGADVLYTTRWYAPGFNPVAGVFFNQNEVKYGNRPYLDAFVNIQWKRACIFVKMENALMGWPFKEKDYFSAHQYIHTVRAVKFGISWPFYTLSFQNAKVSAGGSTTGGSSRGGGGGGTSRGGGGNRGGRL